jgi:hypothetical protein
MIPDKLIRIKDRLERFHLNVPIMIEETLKELTPVIEDLLGEQLQRGERGDGTILPNYSPVSVHVYGKPAGPIRLFETGAFYRGMTLEVTAKDFEIKDTDSKTAKLTNTYGDAILLLSPKSIGVLVDDYLVIELSKKAEQYFHESN